MISIIAMPEPKTPMIITGKSIACIISPQGILFNTKENQKFVSQKENSCQQPL
jgi:hypothetical protein